MNLKGLTTEKSKAAIWLIGGLVVIILAAYYINKTFGGVGKMIGSITDAVGLTTSEEDKKQIEAVNNAKVESTNNNSPWSAQFYKSAPTGAVVLTSDSAKKLAKQIWDSVGIFTSDVEEMYATIKQCKTKSQISFLADTFYLQYRKDLLTWITKQYTKMGVPDKTLTLTIQYVNNLPNYNA